MKYKHGEVCGDLMELKKNMFVGFRGGGGGGVDSITNS